MSSKLVFTHQDGEAETGDDFTIHGNENDARATLVGPTTFAFYYTKITAMSPSAIQDIPYPGFKGMDGRAMRGNTNQFAIEGFIIGKVGAAQSEEVAIWKGMLNLLSKAKLKATWVAKLSTAGSGDVIFSSTGDAHVGDVIANGVGDGTGPRWGFTFPLTNLGSED